MSHPSAPRPVKLLVSLISGEESLIARVVGQLSEMYGKADFVSACLPFTATEYYRAEMGEPLLRSFAAFESLIAPDSLPEVKRATNLIEAGYLDVKGNRRINLDPGYLSLEHLILATCKRYTHRPYLRDGIYADLTLVYMKKSFRSLAWTYPDYASREIISMLNRLRERYRQQLKDAGEEERREKENCTEEGP